MNENGAWGVRSTPPKRDRFLEFPVTRLCGARVCVGEARARPDDVRAVGGQPSGSSVRVFGFGNVPAKKQVGISIFLRENESEKALESSREIKVLRRRSGLMF